MTPAMPFRDDLFSGANVLVTGAGRGIGAAVAQMFLATGAEVLAHVGRTDDHAAQWRETLPLSQAGRLTTVTADLAEEKGVETLAVAAREAFPGGLSVLVNNAGTMLGRIPSGEVDAAHYHRVVDLNARSVVLLCAALEDLLATGAGGAIVNTVSISARTGGSPGSSLYSAAKAFVATHTRSLARELAPRGIRVNAVSPGTIDTDFHARYSSAEKLAATAKAIPLGRLGTPEDCAPSYLFLASDALSGYVTGQVLEINGGQFMG
ncbi:SDR family NAD(P)-dependent oxidoreductase [Caenispirillum salinarum]|uniref:SDR family NAD(P)-dependent oxidoreductase n=1 Tax=Caenispirillum salinarum TaxID=859058 RepID=UPI003850D83A